MSRPRTPLPPGLDGRSVRSADLPSWGIGRSRTRHDDFDRPFHGMAAVNVDRSQVLGACTAFEAVRLSGQVYSHTTAAALYGIPLPSHIDQATLHLSVPAPRTAPRRPGIVGHSIRVHEFLPRRLDGLPVMSPADTWCHLAALISAEDLVAAGDYIISPPHQRRTRRPPLATIPELRAAAVRHRGNRGAKRLTWALPLLRPGVDSPPETHLRLLLIASGLPEPLIADPTPVEGGLVLHPDLKYPQWRVAIEYEGDGHRLDKRQWRRDITRRELLESAGWRVIRVTADDLYIDPDALIRRIRSVLRQRQA